MPELYNIKTFKHNNKTLNLYALAFEVNLSQRDYKKPEVTLLKNQVRGKQVEGAKAITLEP